MRVKRDPSHKVVEYFETAPPATAAAVLSICQLIVKRRRSGFETPTPRRARREKVNDADAVTNHEGIGIK
jgi:hypothetical protein